MKYTPSLRESLEYSKDSSTTITSRTQRRARASTESSYDWCNSLHTKTKFRLRCRSQQHLVTKPTNHSMRDIIGENMVRKPMMTGSCLIVGFLFYITLIFQNSLSLFDAPQVQILKYCRFLHSTTDNHRAYHGNEISHSHFFLSTR